MREIKFRAFVNGEMTNVSYPQTITFSDGRLTYWDELKHSANTSAIIMQYTGLKDVNNAEVYEADYFDTEDGLMEVYFIDGRFILMWADTGTYRCELHEAVNKLSKCGNKYENPDLLTS